LRKDADAAGSQAPRRWFSHPMIRFLALVPLVALAACGRDPAPPPATNIADNGVPVQPTPRPSPDATGPGTALGLTYLELEDADLIDASGRERAEVERIDADRAGTIGGLVVELKGPPADGRMVRIPITGLSIVPDGDGYDLRTQMTGDQLAALPAAPDR